MKSVNLWRWRCQAAVFLVFVLASLSSGLNSDGTILLKFKSSILNDSLQVLSNWNFWDQTPCQWNGITCQDIPSDSSSSRVISLTLPNSQLLGSIPSELLTIKHLRHLNLANNSFNGSLPFSMLNSTSHSQLTFLDLSSNWISGELPEVTAQVLQKLQALNLSDNALAGKLPSTLSSITNLTVISLKNNYFSGELPNNFNSVHYLDLSSNLINSSLSNDFGGQKLTYLNISYNRLFGEIPQTLGDRVPENATIDISFNNFTGQIPNTRLFLNQPLTSYTGNPNLCGRPLKNLCTIPSTLSNPPNVTDSPPAIAAIPNNIPGAPGSDSNSSGLRLSAILGIVFGDLAGVLVLAVVFFYVYRVIKKRRNATTNKAASSQQDQPSQRQAPAPSSEPTPAPAWCSCLPNRDRDGPSSTSTSAASSDSDENDESSRRLQSYTTNSNNIAAEAGPTPRLVAVDGGGDLELEPLLKASAYILGATGSTILYKAVLENGSVLAVRRIGETGPDHRFKDFENQIRAVGKLVHPNVVRVKGFYIGPDQKLIIYEFVPNGSLATACYRKAGSSPFLLPWEIRLKIAKGVARGLIYIHEKKHVHGNLKPSNVLLGFDFEPKIGDFGLERLLAGDVSNKVSGSSRIFGSKRSMVSRDSFHDASVMGVGLGPSPSPSSFGMSPYAAPESLRSIKPNSKCDVYSFGVIFLELLTGKVTSHDEMGQSNMEMLFVEDKNRVIRMADVTIRGDVEGKEDALMACFKLGISCVSATPQKRPSMKEVLQVLDKLPSSSSSSSSSPHFYNGF